MSKTRHLDAAIEIFSSKKAKRAKPKTDYTLNVLEGYAVLQGARGKTIAMFYGAAEVCEEQARAKIPKGKTLEVYK